MERKSLVLIFDYHIIEYSLIILYKKACPQAAQAAMNNKRGRLPQSFDAGSKRVEEGFLTPADGFGRTIKFA